MKTNCNLHIYRSSCFFTLLFCLMAMPAFGRDKTTTADEYKKKYAVIQEKAVTLPSGAIFKITSIDQRALNQLLGRLNLSMDEYNRLVHKKFEKMSPKEIGRHMDFWEAMIAQSVVAPEMCIEPEDGKLEVRLLTPEDMDKLQEEIGKLNTRIPELPLKPLSAAPTSPDAPQYTVSRLLMDPDKYEGKSVDVYGEVDGELSDIGISPRQGNSVSLQRFYLTDGKKKLLVIRFYVKDDRLHMKSFLRDIFHGKDDSVKVHVKDAKFTSQWINEPVVLTHGKKIDKIKSAWMETARRNIEVSK